MGRPGCRINPGLDSEQHKLSFENHALGRPGHGAFAAPGATASSLAIDERLAKADPTNMQAQRDLSISYTKLGDLMVAVGNLPAAERFYRDSLAIRERAFGLDDPETQRIREKIRTLEGDDQ